MDIRYVSVLLLLITNTAIAQNLVPNPSFESLNRCPEGLQTIDDNFTYLQQWTTPSNGSPDYYHTCGKSGANMPNTRHGVHYTHSGNGMIGIWAYSETQTGNSLPMREYIQCKLNSKLKAGSKYLVRFYAYLTVNGVRASHVLAIDRLGICFEDKKNSYDTSIAIKAKYGVCNQSGVLLDKPDTWVKIEGMYTANGNEEWLLLGVFNDGIPVKTKQIKGIFTPPYLAQGYYMIDDIYVAEDTTGAGSETSIKYLGNNTDIQVYPNPAIDELHIKARLGTYDVVIKDLHGAIVYKAEHISSTQLIIPVRDWIQGIYLVILQYDKGMKYMTFVKQ